MPDEYYHLDEKLMWQVCDAHTSYCMYELYIHFRMCLFVCVCWSACLCCSLGDL